MTMSSLATKRRRWKPHQHNRRLIVDSDDEESSTTSSMERPIDTSPLTSLPTELLQHIFFHLLHPCLLDSQNGERLLRHSILSLASTSLITRSNIIAVLRMLRQEIATGGSLVASCARPWEMRVLVLTLDYRLGTGSTLKVRIERWREVERFADVVARREREKEEMERVKGYALREREGRFVFESEEE